MLTLGVEKGSMASRVNEDKTTVKDDEAILSIFPSDPLYQWLYYKGKVPQGEREENLLRSMTGIWWGRKCWRSLESGSIASLI